MHGALHHTIARHARSIRAGIRMAAITALLAHAPASLRAQGTGNPADVAFMQGMIGHHGQALRMTSLVPERTTRADVRMLAEKIEASQLGEITTMKRWLADHHQEIPADPMASGPHTGMQMSGNMKMDMPALMPGMLTEQEMAQLAATKGADFDKQFLTFMIRHHEGALTMVARLLGTAGAAQESQMFGFSSDVDADQRGEIKRMRAMLNAPAQKNTRGK
ncbi:MAG: DUF305 domain-containing protein [bacterium]